MKYLFFTLLCPLSFHLLHAQVSSDEGPKTTFDLGGGLWVGTYSGYSVQGDVQRFMTANIAIGGFALIGDARDEHAIPYTKAQFTRIIIGPRLAWVFNSASNLNLYIIALLGYGIKIFQPLEPNESYLAIGLNGGIRYFFDPNIGIFLEAGVGSGLLSGGVVYRFR